MRSRRVRHVFEEGRRSHGERVVVFLAPGPGDVAFVASGRLGGAVARNRARRILREAWRRLPRELAEAFDAVVVARESVGGAKTQDLVEEMESLVRKARGG